MLSTCRQKMDLQCILVSQPFDHPNKSIVQENSPSQSTHTDFHLPEASMDKQAPEIGPTYTSFMAWKRNTQITMHTNIPWGLKMPSLPSSPPIIAYRVKQLKKWSNYFLFFFQHFFWSEVVDLLIDVKVIYECIGWLYKENIRNTLKATHITPRLMFIYLWTTKMNQVHEQIRSTETKKKNNSKTWQNKKKPQTITSTWNVTGVFWSLLIFNYLFSTSTGHK